MSVWRVFEKADLEAKRGSNPSKFASLQVCWACTQIRCHALILRLPKTRPRSYDWGRTHTSHICVVLAWVLAREKKNLIVKQTSHRAHSRHATHLIDVLPAPQIFCELLSRLGKHKRFVLWVPNSLFWRSNCCFFRKKHVFAGYNCTQTDHIGYNARNKQRNHIRNFCNHS